MDSNSRRSWWVFDAIFFKRLKNNNSLFQFAGSTCKNIAGLLLAYAVGTRRIDGTIYFFIIASLYNQFLIIFQGFGHREEDYVAGTRCAKAVMDILLEILRQQEDNIIVALNTMGQLACERKRQIDTDAKFAEGLRARQGPNYARQRDLPMCC